MFWLPAMVAAIFFPGCRFNDAIPQEVLVSCEKTAVCPNDTVCVADVGRCVVPGPCVVTDGDAAAFVADGTACPDNTDQICIGGGCTESQCGDGVRDPRIEECDDGNEVDEDECTNRCTAPRCGDGIVQSGEACDDGNDVDVDACRNTCQAATCGDAVTRNDLLAGESGHEACDDGNLINTDACTFSCQAATCGDGFTQPGEGCDDGNDIENDGCTNACRLPSCGDGVVQSPEQCDDGNDDNGDACTNQCTQSICGDGIVRADVIDPLDPGYEECDDGNGTNADGCLSSCIFNTCGDGEVNPSQETCDDGNLERGDGCSADCNLISWTRSFGAGDLVKGRVAVGNPGLGEDYGSGEVPATPHQVAIMDSSNVLHVLDPSSGETLWSQAIGETFVEPLLFLGRQYVFATAEGHIYALSMETGELPTACDPATDPAVGESFCLTLPEGRQSRGLMAFLTAIPPIGSIPPFLSLNGMIFLDDETVWDLQMPGRVVIGNGPFYALNFEEVTGLVGLQAPDPMFRASPALQFAGGSVLVPTPDAGIQAIGNLCNHPNLNALNLVTDPPEDLGTLTSEIAFLGNGAPGVAGDVAYARGEDGRVFLIDLPATGGTEECTAEYDVSALHLRPKQISRIPIMIAPLAGHQVIWVDESNRVRRGTLSAFMPGDVVLFELDPLMTGAVSFDSRGGAYDADGGIYLLDTLGVLRQIQVVTGTLAQTWQVPDWQVGTTALADSPMVFGRLVTLPLNDGRLIALEQGGLEPPHGASWNRSSGSHYGPMYLGCQSRSHPALWLFLVLLLVWPRRARRHPGHGHA
jgi:cysteine-rich repeat protein